MSIFSTIEVDIKKFFATTGSDVEKFANAFWNLFKKAPTALQTVDNFITEVGAVVIAAVSLADPLAEPAAAAALATVETGLAGIQAAATAASVRRGRNAPFGVHCQIRIRVIAGGHCGIRQRRRLRACARACRHIASELVDAAATASP